MSISNLLSTNSYNLFANTVNARELLADVLESSNLDVTGELIADKIVNTTGFNYLSPWSSTKDYITNDLVISNNQIFRCLVGNTNNVPDPNNPAQVQWVPVTSNNAILSERQYAQVHLTNGNDVKALVSAIPFQSIPAALAYLKSVNGGYCKIMSVGQNNVYGDGSEVFLVEYDNIILDGGDASISYLDNPQNKINYKFSFIDSENVTLKNLTISKESPLLLDTDGCNNVSLENITFEDNGVAAPRVRIQATTPFGSHTFTNCYMTPGFENYVDIEMYDLVAPNTKIIFDNTGLVTRSFFRINTINVDPATAANLTIIVRNSYVTTGLITHLSGMTLIFENCILRSSLISTAASGSITLTNCSFLDPVTNVWSTISLTGTAQYKLIDCFTNPNSNTDVINIAGNVNSLNYTSGPAARFNRLVTWAGSAPTSTGSTQAIVPVLAGGIMTNAWNILTYNVGTGAVTFNTPGIYQLLISLSVQNTNTANEQTVLHCFFGASGSNEGSSLAVTSTDRGFVGSAGILASFPNSRRGVALFFQVTTIATPYFFYVRNLSGTAYNVTIEAMSILQIR